jgi:hypothetical protein
VKRVWLLILLLPTTIAAQNAGTEKPCIAFSPESGSPTNAFAKGPLEDSVMLSGDFVFFPSRHEGCWNVHVLSVPVSNAKGKHMGYAVSHTVTDPQSIEVGHGLTCGPDQNTFLQAMHKAAADAIRSIRLARPASQSRSTTQSVQQDHQ